MTAAAAAAAPRGAGKAAPSSSSAAAAAASTGGAHRRARSAKLCRSSSSSSSSRPLFLPPALCSALLLMVVVLLAGGGAGTAAAASEDGVLTPAVPKIGVPTPAPEVRPPQGLYFFLTSKAPRRCFVLTEGKGSMFHVHYNFPAAADGEKIALELRPLSDDSTPKNRFSPEPIDTKLIDTEEGSRQFMIKNNKDATYSLCAVTYSKTIKKGRGLKLYLDLDTGKQDKAYDRLKKEFTLDDLQISMIQLKNSAQQMLRTADYSKELETVYHKLLLQLNREVLWWPVSQVVILVVMGFYQVRHLKKFFKSKRLV